MKIKNAIFNKNFLKKKNLENSPKLFNIFNNDLDIL